MHTSHSRGLLRELPQGACHPTIAEILDALIQKVDEMAVQFTALQSAVDTVVAIVGNSHGQFTQADVDAAVAKQKDADAAAQAAIDAADQATVDAMTAKLKAVEPVPAV